MAAERAHRRLLCVVGTVALLSQMPLAAFPQSEGGNVAVAGAIGASTAISLGRAWNEYRITHSLLTGCVVKGPNSLELHSAKDRRTYQLSDATRSLKPGIVVRVKGSKGKTAAIVAAQIESPAGPIPRPFRVDRVLNVYGSCPP